MVNFLSLMFLSIELSSNIPKSPSKQQRKKFKSLQLCEWALANAY